MEQRLRIGESTSYSPKKKWRKEHILRKESRPWPTVSPKLSSSNMETSFFSLRPKEKCRCRAAMGSVSITTIADI